MDSAQEAETLVRQFLRALENRNLELASGMLAPGANIVFPGPIRFTSFDEIVEWAQNRYQRIRKTFEHINTATLPGGEVVVYVMGELYGLNLHDVEFSGVRYIDRFVIRANQIVSHEVWNDLAESGVLEQQ